MGTDIAKTSRMMKSVLFVALLVALASPSSALPDDLIIPEDVDLLQETAWADSVERVNSLLAVGKDDKACADLAKSEKKAIQDSVDTNQKLLNELPTGVDCKLEGVDLVETQKKEWFKTHEELINAKNALELAGSAEIDFGKRTFLSIASTGACAIEKSDLKYVAAKGVYDAAQKKVVTATAKHKAAIKGYNEAVAAADKQKKECKCDVQKKHADAWKKANAANASNQKGWTQATNMLCVTGGTHYKDCKGSTAPTVKKPYIDNGAKNAKCSTPLPAKYTWDAKGKITGYDSCKTKAGKAYGQCWGACSANWDKSMGKSLSSIHVTNKYPKASAEPGTVCTGCGMGPKGVAIPILDSGGEHPPQCSGTGYGGYGWCGTMPGPC